MTDNNNIENLFKDAFDKYEAPVDASVWEGVQQGLKNIPAPAVPVTAVVKSFSVIKSVIAIVAISTLAVITYSVLKPTSPQAIPAAAVANEIVTEKNNFTNNNIAAFSDKQKNNHDAKTIIPKSNVEKIKEATLTEQSVNSTMPAEQSSVQSGSQRTSASLQETAIPSEPLKVTTDTHPLESAEQKQNDATSAKTNEPDEQTTNASGTDARTCDEPNLTNTFTPNNDGINDVYFISDNNLKEIQVKILNLRGKIIKQWDKKAGFWDGKLPNGSNAETGTYMLIVNAVCNNGAPFKKKINIQLIRQ